jgi:Fur family ferric uptake transcriptional regulator
MIRKIIKENGYKLTTAREKVLNVLEKAKRPFSAQEIYGILDGKIDQASIYRNLKLFGSLGLVKNETIGDVKKYFLGQNHHHIVCRICSAIKCVPCREGYLDIDGFEDIQHELTLTGTCKRCSQKI